MVVGAGAFAEPLSEEYAEAPGGQRTVWYFDKSRMEITHPEGDPSADWYVTNGLLARELMTGDIQLGDDTFEEHRPAAVNLAGDPDDDSAPSYATFQRFMDDAPLPDGAAIIWRTNRGSRVEEDPALAAYQVTAAHRVTLPGIDHQVASPFWAFMHSSGVVWEDGGTTIAPLFVNPFYATGLPLTEAYWATVQVAGVDQDVLIQCFERRCLTYTPGNPEGWQVEAGNVGQHYYRWRYGEPSN